VQYFNSNESMLTLSNFNIHGPKIEATLIADILLHDSFLAILQNNQHGMHINCIKVLLQRFSNFITNCSTFPSITITIRMSMSDNLIFSTDHNKCNRMRKSSKSSSTWIRWNALNLIIRQNGGKISKH